MVGNFIVLGVGGVSQSNQKLASGVAVEVGSSVAFNPSLIPDGRLFALSINFRNNLIEVT